MFHSLYKHVLTELLKGRSGDRLMDMFNQPINKSSKDNMSVTEQKRRAVIDYYKNPRGKK